MITKTDYRETGSNRYVTLKFTQEPVTYLVTQDDIYDPGRIALNFGYPIDLWPIILKFNNILDPLADLDPGDQLLIPTLADIKRFRNI